MSCELSDHQAEHHFLHRHLEAIRNYADRPHFRPYLGEHKWGCITYAEHGRHLASAASQWTTLLAPYHIPQGSVIGLWILGSKYEDLVNMLSLSALGFVPQLLASALSPTTVPALLLNSTASALVVDASLAVLLPDSPVPCFHALKFEDHIGSHCDATLPKLPNVAMTDIAIISHSSGTTGDTPRLIPQSHRWISQFHTKWSFINPPNPGRPTVMNSFGSYARIGSLAGYLGSSATGGCTVQCTRSDSPPDDLPAMIEATSLNILALYTTFLSYHIKAAQRNPTVLCALRGLTQIVYMGLTLDPHDEDWGYDFRNGLKLRNVYACSETTSLMVSSLGHTPSDRLLRVFPGSSCQLIPYQCAEANDSIAMVQESKSDGVVPLFEAVLPCDVADGPPKSLYHEDGCFHTRDLFELKEAAQGGRPAGYIYRGRADDWIVTTEGNVDSATTEAAVQHACSDIIHDVVVVGQGRPSFVLLVEVMDPPASPGTQYAFVLDLKQEIVCRMAKFNASHYKWERINDPRRIVALSTGELERTGEKGNIRREASARKFQHVIDKIFQ